MIIKRNTVQGQKEMKFTGANGKEFVVRNDCEYKIKYGGKSVIATIAEIVLIGGQPKLRLATELTPGWISPIRLSDATVRCDSITDVIRMSSEYARDNRKKADLKKNYTGEIEFFGFENWNEPDKVFWIPVRPNEFISVEIPDESRKTGKAVYYGEMLSIEKATEENTKDILVFRRYMSNSGQRSIKEITIPCEDILSVYKNKLEISEYKAVAAPTPYYATPSEDISEPSDEPEETKED